MPAVASAAPRKNTAQILQASLLGGKPDKSDYNPLILFWWPLSGEPENPTNNPAFCHQKPDI
jgi:hypothetical protein